MFDKIESCLVLSQGYLLFYSFGNQELCWAQISETTKLILEVSIKRFF